MFEYAINVLCTMTAWVDLENQIKACASLDHLEELRISILGKSGLLTAQLKQLGTLSPEEKRVQGAALNEWRDRLTKCIQTQKDDLESLALNEKLKLETLDVTLPERPQPNGSIHLLSSVIHDIKQYFNQFGFSIAEGPEIEDEFHNFDALNIPTHHPARQSHDTFYIHNFPGMLLRTHTSTVQIRTLKKNKPPLRVIAPGRVYRNDNLDATHTPMFHQVEGLVLDKNIHFGHLKACIIDFCRWFFEKKDLPVRFRPSFFPFTEPSAEVDIGCKRSSGKLSIGDGSDWLEILGCGMVHPNVLKSCNVNSNEFQGFAFGMGIERLTMLKYGISDIRQLYDADVRWAQATGKDFYA